MLSLIRKYSGAQQQRQTPDKTTEEEAKDGKKEQKEEEEEVDGTTYDPNADPRDPDKYYTFPPPVDADEQQPTDSQATSQRPTPQNEEFAVSAEEGAISTPSKPTASPGSAAATTTTPPFWPTSPFPRQRSGSTTPLSPLQRRRTVDETPVRQQNLRRSSDQTQQPTSYENHQIVSPSHQQKTRHQILGSGQQPRPSGSLEAEQRSPRPLQQTRRASAQPTRQERLSGPSHVGWEVRYRSPVREVHESPGRQSRRTSDQGKGSPGVHGKGSGSGG